MGMIHQDVRDTHLKYYSGEERILAPFLPHFSVNWGRRRRAYNTELSVYFLKPDPHTKEAFGLQSEVLLVYAPYAKMEARTLQASESFIFDEPGAGRVDQLVYFVASQADDVRQWIEDYLSRNKESRLTVAFNANALRSAAGDEWHVWNMLSEQLFNRDLFDYRLPLERDTYFFGRDDIVRSYGHAIRLSENKGLFGLRKTGKTSLLYKLERFVESERSALFLYYDCKSPSIRKLRWHQLLRRICEEIAHRSRQTLNNEDTEITIADTFTQVVKRATKKWKRIILAFDEIEFISPVALEDRHWHQDFVPFWQAFWACQSRCRQLSTIIAGVNPKVVELDVINGIQNPLFGIVSYQYLKGFTLQELQLMLDTLGSRMGLNFDRDALAYLHKRYGGHPLLTRLACSLVNSAFRAEGIRPPIKIEAKLLLGMESECDMDLIFYCRHVVSELEQFYPDEYHLLECLASGQLQEFMEYTVFPEFTKHLKEYGLLGYDNNGLPYIAIPVVARYVGLELARRERRKTIYKIVSVPERGAWLRRRVETIIRDLRLLERQIRSVQGVELYGINSFPEGERFFGTKPCQGEEDFVSFINTCNRCFVEAIDAYGNAQGNKNFYWSEVKSGYPGLWHALQRTRLYRHYQMHLLIRHFQYLLVSIVPWSIL